MSFLFLLLISLIFYISENQNDNCFPGSSMHTKSNLNPNFDFNHRNRIPQVNVPTNKISSLYQQPTSSNNTYQNSNISDECSDGNFNQNNNPIQRKRSFNQDSSGVSSSNRGRGLYKDD